MKSLRHFLILSSAFLCVASCHADNDLISVFPLDHYSQNISDWIKPNDADYDKLLLSSESQQKRLDNFYDHFFGAHSPWSYDYVTQILRQTNPNILQTEKSLLTSFGNENKSANEIGYGENFRPHTQNWLQTISANINFSQFENLNYDVNNQGIAIDNLHARVLPTNDVHFYSYKLAGQGYPFDNLQMSALWAGTPVYILAESKDHAWSMVITPEYIAWVESRGIARISTGFADKWKAAAKKQLVAITHTQTGIVDHNNHFRFSAYVGSVFPAQETSDGYKVMIPVNDGNNNAVIDYTTLSRNEASLMPLAATPHNFANVMSTLIGRPYGWGNMYFYNDCSAELKSLFTAFGIWLPRHSSDQVTVGKQVDMTSSAQEQRLAYLIENGRKFMTIIYIGGHVILYVGNHPNPNSSDHAAMAMTYQNVWGLSPKPAIRRAVIGGSVLFPMLLQYPEDTSVASLASKSYFQVSYLDEMPASMLKYQLIDLQSLMSP